MNEEPRATTTKPSRRSVGLAFAATTAVISGFAVFINGYGVRSWTEVASATTYTTVKNAVAAVVLVALAGAVTRSGSQRGLRRPVGLRQWAGVSGVAVIGGAIPFALFFEGFARASSSQAAFIHKTLVVWVVILAVIILRERIGWLHVAAVGLLVWGQAALLGGVGRLSLGSGEVMMFGATLLWSTEVIIAKKLLAAVPPLTLAVARMAGGAGLLVLYGVASSATVSFEAMGLSHILWVLLTGAVLAAYVATWYSALARAQAVDVTAVLVGGALITAALNVGVRGLAVPPIAGLVLVGCGVFLAGAALLARQRPLGVQ